MNKKLLPLVLFLTIILSICLSACGDKPASSNPNSGKPTDNNSQNNQSPSVVEVTSVSISPSQLNLTVGDKQNVTATVAPSNATNKNVIWSSTNSAVAEYINGQILALGEGVCVIKATSTNGVVGSCSVTVSKAVKYFSKVSFLRKEYVFTPGYTYNLSLSLPNEPTDSYMGAVESSDNAIVVPSYTYSESNKTITVKVAVKSEGVATVKVTLDGGATDTVTIISKYVSEDVVKVKLQEFPLTVSYIGRNGRIVYSSISVSSVTVTKMYLGDESSIHVSLKINATKSYDKNGSLGTETVRLIMTLYENDTTYAQESFYTAQKTVGASVTFDYTFDIEYKGNTRDISVVLTDFVS